ncbi:MAG: FAD-binding oxidoreductase [Deltaproteobacteria bacterium]
MKTWDVIIVGGGLIGSSIAYHLKQKDEGLQILLLDVDLSGKYSSSELNAGGIRKEWWREVNIELAKATLEFMEASPDQFGFRQKGYLWLYDKKGWDFYRSYRLLFKKEGIHAEELTPKEVQSRFPFIDRLDGIAGGTFSPKDGLFNPNLLKQFFRDGAKTKGVETLDGAYVTAVEKKGGAITVTYRDLKQVNGSLKDEDVFGALTQKAGGDFFHKNLSCKILVNASGAWAASLSKCYGHLVPTQPVRRQVCLFDSRELDLSGEGMIVDTSGVYFHAEGDHILAGYATPEEPPAFNFKYDGESFFEQEIWPRLIHRISKAEALKHIGGWAGLYEVTPDRSGIMGRVDKDSPIYEAHSFTGRGAMQSYGVGLAMSELIIYGEYRSIDATPLHPDRFRKGTKLLYEGFHI